MTFQRGLAISILSLGLVSGSAVAQDSPQLTHVLKQMDTASTAFQRATADFKWDYYEKIVHDTSTDMGSIYFERQKGSMDMGAVVQAPGGGGSGPAPQGAAVSPPSPPSSGGGGSPGSGAGGAAPSASSDTSESAAEPPWARQLRTAGHAAQTATHSVPTHTGGGAGAPVSLADSSSIFEDTE